MIRGIGTDIIEIERIANSVKRYGSRFLDRIFTEKEQEYCLRHRYSERHLAGRFAAKEAIVKALGTGFRGGISWTDMQIIGDASGKPNVILSEKLRKRIGDGRIEISISHCHAYATATALWIPDKMKQETILTITGHGESAWNRKGLIQGHTNIPLTAAGVEQAEELAEQFDNLPLTAVFSSDLQRASRTAEIIAERHNLPVACTQQLREKYFGKWEGKTFDDIKHANPPLWHCEIEGRDHHDELPSGEVDEVESHGAAVRRVVPFIQQLVATHPQQHLLIVTHDGILRALLAHLGTAHNSVVNIASCAYIEIRATEQSLQLNQMVGITTLQQQPQRHVSVQALTSGVIGKRDRTARWRNVASRQDSS